MLDDEDRFVPVEVAARRMGLTVEQVMELVERHALRARRYGGWGEIEVEPAIVNIKPRDLAGKRHPEIRDPPAIRSLRSQRAGG
ncbi:MAG: hypothetical protein JWR34_7433 [Mycobacterium sp.]|nr:hypothetical protein [Mycobacterium sp.]